MASLLLPVDLLPAPLCSMHALQRMERQASLHD